MKKITYDQAIELKYYKSLQQYSQENGIDRHKVNLFLEDGSLLLFRIRGKRVYIERMELNRI